MSAVAALAPLAGAAQLADCPDAQVLVVQGGLVRGAAQKLYEDAGIETSRLVVLGLPGTAQDIDDIDLSVLDGRSVAVWPNAGSDLRYFADRVAGAAKVLKIIGAPVGVPHGWNLSCEIPSGFGLIAHTKTAVPYLANANRAEQPNPLNYDELAAEVRPDNSDAPTVVIAVDADSLDRPSFASYDAWTSLGKPGLYYHGQKEKGDDYVVFDQWICSPITAEATTRSVRGDNFGLMLKFRNSAGQQREWAMPMSLLKGSGEELRGELLSMGMRIDVDGHRLLQRWLMNCQPERELTAADSIGWHGDSAHKAFVLPRRTIGSQDIVFQSEHIAHDEFSTKGTLAGWQKAIGSLCVENHWLTLAVCSALAGPLLKLTGRAGVGIHFVGDSSLGKSTLLQVAGSVWGSDRFIRTWRATGNGLEGIAAALSDTSLILDEISEAPASEVGSIVYAIGNGTGKSRAARTGAAKNVARWRLSLLSSGEKTLATIMSEAGKSTHAGQEVRLLDIPAKRAFGVFDTLHDLADGQSLSAHLRTTAIEAHHGQLGPAFIECLMADGRDFKLMLQRFGEEAGFRAGFELEGRAAQSLAVLAVAGELATEYGLTTWRPGDALAAAVEAYQSWKAFRGEGQTETRKILQSVETFIDRHGDSRFSDILIDGTNALIRDRAGWWRADGEGRVYMFTAAGLREALKGFEFSRGIGALKDAGWIAETDKDKNSKKTRVRGEGAKPLYWIRQPDDAAEAPAPCFDELPI